MNQLYKAIGISKQAVHQYENRQKLFDEKLVNLIAEVDDLRSEHPGCGVEKIYKTLQPDFIGRDRFIEILMEMGYRVKKVKNYRKTTLPVSHKFFNLIEGMAVAIENTVWQSDITYIELNDRFYYAVFIIDIYSRRIVGWEVADSLRAEANIRALKMALKHRPAPKIHHSDRGSQYIDNRYLKLLAEHNVAVSMGLTAQDNAYAERINGTIKNEYLSYWQIHSFNSLKGAVKRAVEHYNLKRPHDSLPGTITPVDYEVKRNRDELKMTVHSDNKIIPDENIFIWNNEINKNCLICPLTN